MSEQDAEQGERLREISQRLREFGIAHQMDGEIDDLIDDLGLPSGRIKAFARTVVAFGMVVDKPLGMDDVESVQMTLSQPDYGSILIEMDSPDVEIELDAGTVSHSTTVHA